MKRRKVAKRFYGSTAKKQLACLSLAASVLASPFAAYADTASTQTSVDSKMAPVSAVSEGEVLNILAAPPATSTDLEKIAPTNAVYTDISAKPAAESAETAESKDSKVSSVSKDAKETKDAQKTGGKMSKLRKMASRVRLNRDKKQIASAEPAAQEEKKAEATESTTAAETAAAPVEAGAAADAKATQAGTPEASSTASPGWNEGSEAAAKTSTADTAEVKTEASAPAVADQAATAVAPPVDGDASTAAVADAAETIEDNNGDKHDGASIAFGLPGTLNDLEAASKLTPDGIIVVDNDEAIEQNDHLQYEDMPLDEGKSKIKIGARFPVVISSAINSKTAKKGDRVEARLKYDLKIGDKLIAKKGSVVRGHLNYCLKARTILHSLVSPERWYRNSGCVGIDFDEIVNEKGEHIPCVAAPARAGRVIKNKGEGRELGVNHNGQVTGPWAQQLRYKAVRVGLNFALAPTGVFSFGAMPVALGVIGAANPNFAFGRPVGLNVRHRRIKGFAWGFLSGIPGSWLIEDTTVKGQEAIIKPGDEFYAAFKQEFNGEPETDASILAGGSTKVRGQVVKEPAADKAKTK
jgi:hypothetical protein